MSNYSSFFNSTSVDANSVSSGDLTATGNIDFSQATLEGFPVDGTSIKVINGQLSAVNGQFQTEFTNFIYPYSGNAVSVAPSTGQTLITNNIQDNSLTANQLVITNASNNLASLNLANGELLIGTSGIPTGIIATSNNTASTIVERDTSGNFLAGTITANLNGNATTSTTSTTSTNFTTVDDCVPDTSPLNEPV